MADEGSANRRPTTRSVEEAADHAEPGRRLQPRPGQALEDWTQEEAAEQLEQYLGARWSKATFSAAERSIDGRRVRQFTADEIVAFSRCFDSRSASSSSPAARQLRRCRYGWLSPENPWGIPIAELIDVIFGPRRDGVMGMRVEEFFLQEIDRPADRGPATLDDARRGGGRSGREERARPLRTWRNMLTSLANQLEDWQIAARRAATGEEAVDG